MLNDRKPTDSVDESLLDTARIEWSIANALINLECKSVEEVCSRFDLSRQQAVTILDSRSMSKLIDALQKARNAFTHVLCVNRLIEIIETGSGNERIQAIILLERMSQF